MSMSKDYWDNFDREVGIFEEKKVYLKKTPQPGYWLFVKTGDLKGAGTDANVKVILCDANKNASDPILLDKKGNDLERGNLDVFPALPITGAGDITRLELWRDSAMFASAWFCEYIVIYDVRRDVSSYFPINRWIRAKEKYILRENDTLLPQYDESFEVRRKDIADRRKDYQWVVKDANLPVQIKKLPADEERPKELDLSIAKRRAKLMAGSIWTRMTAGRWKGLDDLTELHDHFHKPRSFQNRTFRSDEYFGVQRLAGCNAGQIRLCKALPASLQQVVSDELLSPYLDGMSISHAMSEDRLFIVNHEILQDIQTKPRYVMCAPVALFYWNSRNRLMPVAIQLFQDRFENNPVFVPGDPEDTWTIAKMWFNNADAAVHQGLTRMAQSYLILEGFVCALHRNLAPSHPIKRLLAPHIKYLLDANKSCDLLDSGGWADDATTLGRKGMQQLIARGFKRWRLDNDGILPNALADRGVLYPNILPNYPYRNDALLYHYAIESYVSKIIYFYYDDDKKITEDIEIQNWIKEVVTPINSGGCGIQGVPGNGSFSNADDLIAVLTWIIYTCTARHAAVNNPMYDDYGYPVNYPAILHGAPPHNKAPRTEKDILAIMPTIKETTDMLTTAAVLSEKPAQMLGHWKGQYQFEPVALVAEQEFKRDMIRIGQIVDERNSRRATLYKYDHLHPTNVPNNITV